PERSLARQERPASSRFIFLRGTSSASRNCVSNSRWPSRTDRLRNRARNPLGACRFPSWTVSTTATAPRRTKHMRNHHGPVLEGYQIDGRSVRTYLAGHLLCREPNFEVAARHDREGGEPQAEARLSGTPERDEEPR